MYNPRLAGTFSSVPVPAAMWLFGSGLFGLILNKKVQVE
jgi:hypothetical protein